LELEPRAGAPPRIRRLDAAERRALAFGAIVAASRLE
jgi:hypothetical protein